MGEGGLRVPREAGVQGRTAGGQARGHGAQALACVGDRPPSGPLRGATTGPQEVIVTSRVGSRWPLQVTLKVWSLLHPEDSTDRGPGRVPTCSGERASGRQRPLGWTHRPLRAARVSCPALSGVPVLSAKDYLRLAPQDVGHNSDAQAPSGRPRGRAGPVRGVLERPPQGFGQRCPALWPPGATLEEESPSGAT